MKQLHFLIFVVGCIFSTSYGQSLDPYHLSLVNRVDKQNIESNLLDFVSFGRKESGTNAQSNAKEWLISNYQSWGYTSIEQQAVNISGNTDYNLIITKEGTLYPDTYVVLTAHYDTLNGPGANDNGSGTTILLEIAEILKNVPTEYSIKFIHFVGEELGLIGSTRYVEQIAVPQNLDIKLVLNIDQVGGVAGEVNDMVTCEKDQDWPNSNNNESALVTNQLATLIGLYSSLNTKISKAYGSDYIPFQEAGYVITGLYESNESPYPHSPQDTYQRVDTQYIYEIAKGALGAVCFFARALESMAINDVDLKNIKVFPNPVDKILSLESSNDYLTNYTLTDISGKIIKSGSFTNNVNIETTSFPNGIYLLTLNNNGLKSNKKIIIKHN